MNHISYRDWQAIRDEAKKDELKERSEDMAAPRPPLNASINDMVLRALILRVSELEAKVKQFTGR